MADVPPPSLRLAVNNQALAANWRALDALSGTAEACAAVKADCYGLGVDRCVPALRDAGAREFLVAHWSEVAAVAAHVPAAQIAVLHGPLSGGDLAYARAMGVRPVINSRAQARRWVESGGGTCHLMVDTGINRLGLSMDEIGDPLIAQLDVDILMSHLACADEDVPMNGRQLAKFREAIAAIPARRTSLANSAGIALGGDYAFDLTRPGLALYGGVPRHEMASSIRQVARIEAVVLQVRNLSAGDSVGYNAKFTAPGNMRVGVVSIGYADGLLRTWAGEGYLQSGEARLPILGRVSMDMIVVGLAAAPGLTEGDWLELPYDLPEAARLSGLSQYELLTVIGNRLRG